MNKNIITHSKNGVQHIVIARKDKRNSLNIETASRLKEEFSAASENSAIKTVLFYGEGDEAFCSGADLKELADRNTLAERESFFMGIADLLISIYRCKKPVISKIHGYALAGGMGLVTASDIALASDKATFGLPEIKIGLAPLIVMNAIERICGKRTTLNLALTGENINAAEAARINLITKVIEADKLDTAAEIIAEELAEKSSLAAQIIKERTSGLSSNVLFENLREMASLVATISMSDECQKKLQNFKAKK